MKTRVWIVLPVIVGLILTGCNISLDMKVVRGSGRVTREERRVKGFDRVNLAGTGTLSIEQSDKEELIIEAEDNILPLLTSEVRGNTLALSVKPMSNIAPTQRIHYILKVRDLRELKIVGSGDATMTRLAAEDLSIALVGSGDIEIMDLDAKSVTVNISGSGQVRLAGRVEKQEMILMGSGNYRAEKLESNTATISIPGSGSADVWVKNEIGITIMGSGTVRYSGSPRLTQKITGSGTVHYVGERN